VDGQRIAGIYSTAPGKPIKLTNFGPQMERFDNARSYADWVFMAALVSGAMPPAHLAQPAAKP
jgi:hypothetical protein